MSNKMTKFYVAIVEEIIYKDDLPTGDIRIRVPLLHGQIPIEDLPIAKPMYMPGTVLDINNFIQQITDIKKVYIIFEYGNVRRPRYFGIPDFVSNIDIFENQITQEKEKFKLLKEIIVTDGYYHTEDLSFLLNSDYTFIYVSWISLQEYDNYYSKILDLSYERLSTNLNGSNLVVDLNMGYIEADNNGIARFFGVA